MTAQELKNSILQYAVQGKLVPQDPNDEPASVLLERIKVEKAQLIKDKKIKAEKPLFPISEEEIPFEIPESWKWVKFGEIVNYNMGKTPPRKESINWDKPMFSWVSIADLVSDGVVSNTKELVNQYSFDNVFKKKIVPKGTLLMSFKLTVGKVSILNIDSFHNEAIISIFPYIDNDKITTNFLFKSLPLLSRLGDTKSAIKGNTLNSDSLNSLLIPFPPLAEQQRIVAKIEELMPLVEEYDKAEKELTELNAKFPEQIKKSVLQYAIQGKLVAQSEVEEPASELLKHIKAEKQQLIKEKKIKAEKPLPPITEEDIPFEIPESWVWVRLGEICLDVLGGFAYDSTKFTTINTGNQVIRLGNVKSNKLVLSTNPVYIDNSYAAITEKSKLKVNDLLITMTGTRNKRDYLFTLCLKAHDLNGISLFLNQRVGCFRFSSFVSSEYVNCVLKDTNLIEPIYTSATGSANQANIGINNLKNMLIPLPPLSEQQRIVEKVEEVLGVCEGLK